MPVRRRFVPKASPVSINLVVARYRTYLLLRLRTFIQQSHLGHFLLELFRRQARLRTPSAHSFEPKRERGKLTLRSGAGGT